MIKHAALCFLVITTSIPSSAAIIDRIAAIVNDQVITTSEIDQSIAIRITPQRDGEDSDEYRREVLDDIIAYRLRYSDVERFGAIDVANDEIEARIALIRSRFSSPGDLDRAMDSVELSRNDLEAILFRRIQVERYIEERFSPLIFVSLEEIDAYYRNEWLPSRFRDGLPRLGLSSVREEIRAILRSERLREEVERWTTQLRARSNVDVYGTR